MSRARRRAAWGVESKVKRGVGGQPAAPLPPPPPPSTATACSADTPAKASAAAATAVVATHTPARRQRRAHKGPHGRVGGGGRGRWSGCVWQAGVRLGRGDCRRPLVRVGPEGRTPHSVPALSVPPPGAWRGGRRGRSRRRAVAGAVEEARGGGDVAPLEGPPC
eukprot:TRINITY_DN4535_c0_g1_i2.p1 TRINITY_DN4535_c0_g1~~TRINITY_DN4535_c0_g1_i2.p1  ORF type:complete len:164 (-),score=17.36 TRINITY_DN4535_c0_g1_i2:177-668(-)